MQTRVDPFQRRGKAASNNERLEFLGDRVLGLIVTEMLFKSFPEATQGELALRFNALVSGATCARDRRGNRNSTRTDPCRCRAARRAKAGKKATCSPMRSRR